MDLLQVEWGLSPLKLMSGLDCHWGTLGGGASGEGFGVREQKPHEQIDALTTGGVWSNAFCLLHAPTCPSAFCSEVKKLEALAK